MIKPVLKKKPDEEYPIGFKYIAPDLAEGETLASCTVTISPDEEGGLKVSGDPVVASDTVSQKVTGGVDGHEYYVKFLVLTSAGHKYEDSIFVKVRAVESS